MKVFAPVFALVTLVVSIAYFLSPPRQPYTPLVSVDDLLFDPDYWNGRTVKVQISGMIAGDKDTLVYKKILAPDGKSLIVLTWGASEPRNRPSIVVGVFHSGTPHRITEARPVP